MLKQLLVHQLLEQTSKPTSGQGCMVKMAAVHAPGDEVKDTQFEQVPLVENQMRKFTREEMREVLPVNVQNNVAYDLIRDPLRYAESALKISRMVGRAWKGASFLPFRRSSVRILEIQVRV